MPQIGARTGIHVAGLGMHAWGCLTPQVASLRYTPKNTPPQRPVAGCFTVYRTVKLTLTGKPSGNWML